MWKSLQKLFGEKKPASIAAVDPKKIAEKLSLVDLVIRAAQDQEAPADPGTLSPEETAIVDVHLAIAKSSQADYLAQISEAEERQQEASERLDSEQFDSISEENKQTLVSLEGENLPELIEAKNNERHKLLELKGYKEKYGITHDAVYPDSYTMLVAVFLTVLAAEGFANAMFFAEGSELGLLGGAIQAFVVSGLSVGISACAGASFRWFNLGGLKRGLAALGAIAYVVALPLFHLLIAHYRTALAKNVDTAAQASVHNLVYDPFGVLWDLQNCMLIAVGLALGIIAAVKGYRADDRYPGHGKLTRRYIKAREEYKAVRQACTNAVTDAQDSFIARIRQVMHESGEALTEFRLASSEVERLVRNYDNLLESIAASCQVCLRRYHQIRSRVQEGQVQELRDENPFEIERFQLTGVEVGDKDPLRKKQDLERKGREMEHRLRALYTEYITDLNQFYAEIETHGTPLREGDYKSRVERVLVRMERAPASEEEPCASPDPVLPQNGAVTYLP